jgi:hypothetical protein
MHDDIVVSIPRLDDGLDPKPISMDRPSATNYFTDGGSRGTLCCSCDK